MNGFFGKNITRRELAAVSGAASLGTIATGPRSIAATVQDKLSDSVSIKDLGAVADGITDNTAKVQLALNALGTNGGVVHVNYGCRFNLKGLVFPAQSNLTYRMTDDLSRPNPVTTLGSNELVNFAANSNAHGIVNEYRFTAAFHPGLVIDARSDITGQDAFIGSGQSRINPIRSSLLLAQDQVSIFRITTQKYASYSIHNGPYLASSRITITLNGVGSSDAGWKVPSINDVITGVTSQASGYVIAITARSTTVLWIRGRFIAGEKLISNTQSAGTITPVALNQQLSPLGQSIENGQWSIGLPNNSGMHLFSVAGKIAALPSTSFGQYNPFADKTETAFVLADLAGKDGHTPTNGFEIRYPTTGRASSRRVTLRKLGLTSDVAHLGAVHCHTAFGNSVTKAISSYNVSSVTRVGTGEYKITFTNPAVRNDFQTTLTVNTPMQYAYVYSSSVSDVTIRVVIIGTATPQDLTGLVFVHCLGGDI